MKTIKFPRFVPDGAGGAHYQRDPEDHPGHWFGPERVAEFRDQLDEILGDRETYKELDASLRKMSKALHANIAAQELLGLLPGADIMDGIAEWAKIYKPPKPSPDLKEAIGEALRSWKYEGRSLDGLMAHGIEMDEEHLMPLGIAKGLVGEIAAHLAEAVPAAPQPRPGWSPDRISLAQEIAEGLRRRGHWVPQETASADLITAVFKALDEAVATTTPPPPSTPDPEALQWAAEQIAKVPLPVDQAGLRQRALAAVRMPQHGLSAAEAEAIRYLAELARTWGRGRTPDLSAEVDEMAEVAITAADRLQGAAGGPEGAEGTGLEARITRLSAQWAEKFNDLKRSYGHLPADAEALAALVDAAVERSLAEDIRDEVALQTEGIRTQIDNALGRLQTLELHRQGLPDGQAVVSVDDFARLANRLREQERARAEPAAKAEAAAKDSTEDPGV